MMKQSTTPKMVHVERVKVVIVGAGASGLECANCLIHDNSKNSNSSSSNCILSPADILLLEARDRTGGRIHTTHEQLVSPQVSGELLKFPLDHGAAWVSGTGADWGVTTPTAAGSSASLAVPEPNPIMELLEAATLPTENVHDKYLKFYFSGNPSMRPKSMAHEQNEIVLYVQGTRLDKESPLIAEALRHYFVLLEQVSNVGTALYELEMEQEVTRRSLQDAICQVQNQPKFRERLQDFTEAERAVIQGLTDFYVYMIESWEGASASELQLDLFTEESDAEDGEFDEVYTEEGDFYGPHCMLRHGMESVLQPLLKEDIVSRIRLNEEVTKIRLQDGGDGVTVETSTGLTVHADCCVVTLPVGCLQAAIGEQQLFQPQLSDRKQEAIRSFKMGSYKKVFLTFDHIFWPPAEAILGLVRTMTNKTNADDNDSPLGNTLMLDNLWARDGIPCIEAVLVGNVGFGFSHKSDDEIRDAVLNFMEDAMGLDNLASQCTACHVTRWEEDPFSRGTYSHLALGAQPRHADDLRRPEWDGRLVLAGEATVVQYQGSVHAALFSGRAAAKSAADRIHK